ncbi:hypothetical protein DL771_002169 [Monosporascus sp. 5C6A]|nr:hypothetical protein DL771_002169 [Monosporascus sp. 5C6A]
METGSPVGLHGPLHDPTPPSNCAHVSLEGANPKLTEALWQDFMASRGSGSKRGGRAKGAASRTDCDSGKIGPSAPASTRVFEYSESQATPEAPCLTPCRPSRLATSFTAPVLNPRGIYIADTHVIVPSAFAHFSTDEPQAGAPVH